MEQKRDNDFDPIEAAVAHQIASRYGLTKKRDVIGYIDGLARKQKVENQVHDSHDPSDSQK